jgi:uncharacterized protein (TIRG00374 family)
MFLFAKSLNINIPIVYLAISVTLAGIVSMLPISYLGLGTRDAILVAIFAQFNITKEVTIVFSTLILSTYIIMAGAGLIAWQINPLKLHKRKSN